MLMALVRGFDAVRGFDTVRGTPSLRLLVSLPRREAPFSRHAQLQTQRLLQ